MTGGRLVPGYPMAEVWFRDANDDPQPVTAANPLPTSGGGGGGGGSSNIQGYSANLTTASGNPVQIGGVYKAAGMVPSDGQVVYLTVDSVGALRTSGPVSGDRGVGMTDLNAPIKIGGQANANAPTAVSSGQRQNAWFGLNGQLATMLVAADGSAVSPLQAGGSVAVSNFPATQAVSAASLPLPAGASTAAKQDVANAALAAISGTAYEAVAASSTSQVLGATGAVGDVLTGLLITPLSTSPGAVSVQDGSGTAITLFAGGASSVTSLVPFFVPLGAKSVSGAWKVTTGANVTVIGVGSFA